MTEALSDAACALPAVSELPDCCGKGFALLLEGVGLDIPAFVGVPSPLAAGDPRTFSRLLIAGEAGTPFDWLAWVSASVTEDFLFELPPPIFHKPVGPDT